MPSSENIYWKDVLTEHRVYLKNHAFHVYKDDTCLGTAYWLGQEAETAQKYLGIRAIKTSQLERRARQAVAKRTSNTPTREDLQRIDLRRLAKEN